MPVLPSPSVIQRPILSLPLQQKWHNGQAIHGHNPDEQYTLSYGMDQSVLRHAKRPMSIEGSFYEDMDGLNGNLTGGFFSARDQHRKGWDASDDLYTPDDEGERRRGYQWDSTQNQLHRCSFRLQFGGWRQKQFGHFQQLYDFITEL